MVEKIIEFTRTRDYIFIKELGEGACGKTVLLHDDIIDSDFVCKKYQPFDEEQKQTLFSNFVQEVKLLNQLHHNNVVRIFNYYLYPDMHAGFIIMEHVNGTDIEDYIKSQPEKINEIFIQVIDGFCHLEKNNILHRDIRTSNIMVTDDGDVKIIDLGFGKKIEQPDDFDKSIKLNSWCESPEEFKFDRYEFTTEVYFIGKLFENIIRENEIESFIYTSVLEKMCLKSDHVRIKSFFDIEKEINSNKFFEIDFDEKEKQCYREFADKLQSCIVKIESGTKYIDDIDQIQKKIENVYSNVSLEYYVPHVPHLVVCFMNGTFTYREQSDFPVDILRIFLQLFQSISPEKKRIIIANLNTRFDSITRYNLIKDDDIPF